MNKNELIGTDTYIYNETLENGLEVFLIPFPKKKKNYCLLGTKYGSINTEFFLDGKLIKSPDGIAHFLEHKMFNQPDGEDVFAFYSKSGAYVNASTGYNSTAYYFSGTSHFKENLTFLLDFVNTPFYTDENVNGEKGIITEEINMINDNPFWKIEFMINKMLYHNIGYKIPIGGDEKSVNSITKEDLYTVYNNFYNPNNMVLVVCGNFKVENVLELIKNNRSLMDRKKIDIPDYKDDNEPYEVVTKYKEIKLDSINNNKLAYALKLRISDYKVDNYLLDCYLTILFNILFGDTSIFTDKYLKEELFSTFSESRKYDNKYVTVTFNIETDKPKEIIEKINDYIKNYEISDEEVERYKKVLISNCVFNSDEESYMASDIFGDLVSFGEYRYDIIDIIRNISLEDIKRIQKTIDLDNSATLIVNRKEKI